MSVKVMGMVWDVEDLTSSQKLVSTIQKMTGLSERTVQRATRQLEEMGWLIDDGKHPSGTNMWRIPIPDIGGDMVTPPEVTESHPPGDMVTPKPSFNRKKNQENGIPDELNTEEFMTTWKDFKLHRKQIKKPMTPLAETRMLNKLSQNDVGIAVKMLDRSIENGWQGVFELDEKERIKASSKPESFVEWS
ncbi:MAG: hypothetical protein ACYSW6_10370 [Planctomycetota bacterium]|jgi:hypothetical protein